MASISSAASAIAADAADRAAAAFAAAIGRHLHDVAYRTPCIEYCKSYPATGRCGWSGGELVNSVPQEVSHGILTWRSHMEFSHGGLTWRRAHGATLRPATAKKVIFGHGWFIGLLSRSLIPTRGSVHSSRARGPRGASHAALAIGANVNQQTNKIHVRATRAARAGQRPPQPMYLAGAPRPGRTTRNRTGSSAPDLLRPMMTKLLSSTT